MGRDAFGDFQTPPALAAAVCARLAPFAPATIVEPTCGRGAFLAAAAHVFPRARLEGADLSARHLAAARRAVRTATLVREDVFAGRWRERLARAVEPILVLGNPPWVTAADLGVLGSANRPRSRLATSRGLDAVTGRSNFDVSEWVVSELVKELHGRDAILAMLVKTAVARRVLATAWRAGLRVSAELRGIDARASFGVSVDACLLTCRFDATRPTARVFASLDARRPIQTMAFRDGTLVADARAYAAARHLRGEGPAWRSGIKHDCAAVMEVALDAPLECAYPLLKGTDLARGELRPRRALVVSQRVIGEDTRALAVTAPATWRYLTRHRTALAARKSRIYRGRPAYSIFGVGPYSFAPWKVAIAALAKSFAFRVVGPHAGRPVMFDDTCYFVPFATERAARTAARRLERARPLLEALVFWDAKRPITAELLRVVAL